MRGLATGPSDNVLTPFLAENLPGKHHPGPKPTPINALSIPLIHDIPDKGRISQKDHLFIG